MVPRGTILATRGSPGTPHRTLWGPDLDLYRFWVDFGYPLGHSLGSFGILFRDLGHQSGVKSAKSGGSESGWGKKRRLTPPEMAQCGSHAVNTMLFEGSGHVHLDGFWVVLGYLLGSLLVTFGPMWSFWAPKATSQGVHETGWNFDGFWDPPWGTPDPEDMPSGG